MTNIRSLCIRKHALDETIQQLVINTVYHDIVVDFADRSEFVDAIASHEAKQLLLFLEKL